MKSSANAAAGRRQAPTTQNLSGRRKPPVSARACIGLFMVGCAGPNRGPSGFRGDRRDRRNAASLTFATSTRTWRRKAATRRAAATRSATMFQPTETTIGDGQALFLLFGDERRKDDDAAAERVQLPRARHAHADPDAGARR